MTPTAPINPQQQIDSVYRGGVLIEEIVHNYPPDGGGVRRIDNAGVVTTGPVVGLPIPQPTAEERQANYKAAMAAAVTLEDAKEAARLWL